MQSRKRNRLESFEYSNNAYYFITINVIKGSLGQISENGIELNRCGKIVKQCWRNLFIQYRCIQQDEFIIMPDHFHAVIILSNPFKGKLISLSTLVGLFKSVSSKKIRSAGEKTFRWQRSFNDRIIRNDRELFNIRKYIKYNYLKNSL